VPGVPREMQRMWEQTLAPALEAEAGREDEASAASAAAGSSGSFRGSGASGGSRGVIRTLKVNTFGWGESDVADRLDDLMAREGNPTVGTTVAQGIVSVRIRTQYPTPKAADRALAHTATEIERRLGPIAFGRDEGTLSEATLEVLRARNLTVASAESCTAGLIGAMLTETPGSSEVYRGGWVVYTNAMKMAELSVREATLAEHGAVSEPGVRALASGAIEQSWADLAVSVSGVAGPGGGSEAKPVGTVWIGLAWRDDGRREMASESTGDPSSHSEAPDDASVQTVAMRFQLPGDRDAIRERAARCGLQVLRLHALRESLTHLRWGMVHQ
jgi:nicotinamide-nucleotide amidase